MYYQYKNKLHFDFLVKFYLIFKLAIFYLIFKYILYFKNKSYIVIFIYLRIKKILNKNIKNLQMN